MTECQISLLREIEARLRVKCDKMADAFVLDDGGEYPSYLYFIHTLEDFGMYLKRWMTRALSKLIWDETHRICSVHLFVLQAVQLGIRT